MTIGRHMMPTVIPAAKALYVPIFKGFHASRTGWPSAPIRGLFVVASVA